MLFLCIESSLNLCIGSYHQKIMVLSMEIEKWIVYFETAGKANTEKTLKLAKKRALELSIKNILITSTHGYTAEQALDVFDETDQRLIIIGNDRASFAKDLLQTLQEKKIPVVFCDEAEYAYPELMRNAFKKLSEGVKVCMEICMVAAKEGLVPEGEEVIAVAGTSPWGFKNGGGADTALVMIPRRSEAFNKLLEKAKRRDVKEIICKPR